MKHCGSASDLPHLPAAAARNYNSNSCITPHPNHNEEAMEMGQDNLILMRSTTGTTGGVHSSANLLLAHGIELPPLGEATWPAGATCQTAARGLCSSAGIVGGMTRSSHLRTVTLSKSPPYCPITQPIMPFLYETSTCHLASIPSTKRNNMPFFN